MNWKAATRSQLYCIAYDDPMANHHDRRAALEEIKRRTKTKHQRTQYRTKAVYPR